MPSRYIRTVAFRVDSKTEEMINEAWKKLGPWMRRSEALRDIVRVGCAVILGTQAKLDCGATVVVQNPVVKIHVPAKRVAPKHMQHQLQRLHAILMDIAKKIRLLQNPTRIDNKRIYFSTPSGQTMATTPAVLARTMQELYSKIGEALTIVESLMVKEEQEEEKKGEEQ